jgi:hypothetical protein
VPKAIISAALLAAACSSAALAQTTYDVNFTAGNANGSSTIWSGQTISEVTVTGTLILTSGASGYVMPDDIVGYDLTENFGSGLTYTIAGTQANASVLGSAASALQVANGNLYYSPPAYSSTGSIPNGLYESNFASSAGIENSPGGFSYLDFQGPGIGETPSGGFATAGQTSGLLGTIDGLFFGLNGGALLGSDPPSAPAAAPEVDPEGAIAGLTLLAGALLVLRGRRVRQWQ